MTDPRHQFEFEAIGTKWWLGVYQPLTELQYANVEELVKGRIEQFDKTYSRFRPDSLVSQIAQRKGTYHLLEDANELFTFYRQLYDASDGLVTPLIGQVLSDSGYDADYSFSDKGASKALEWDDAMTVNGGSLIVHQPVLLDFGAAGKGYLVDIISALLKTIEINSFCVDAGGDLYCYGTPEPLTIGLEDPDDTERVIGTVIVTNKALCGSSGNRRKWGKYHHIMNPRSLESPRHIAAVWVMADSTIVADGLATALFFTSAEQLGQFNFTALVLYADGSVEMSNAMPVRLFTKETEHA